MMNRSLLVALAMASLGCTEIVPYEVTLSSFRVTLSDSVDRGSAEAPLPFATGRACGSDGLTCESGEECYGGQCSTKVSIDIEAITSNGTRATGFNGPLRLDVTPGTVPGKAAVILMEEGYKTNVEVYINRAMGESHVWVEQDGFIPKGSDVTYGACNDGLDNDGNGLIDLADPGCLNAEDNQEGVVSLASGASETLTFSYPTIREIQYTETSLASTPLQFEQVNVPGGRKVVVNVVANGFYVVDLNNQNQGEYSNGIFVFTFSKPQGVHYGDIICQFAGSLEEHVGMTQVVFPSYVIREADQPACFIDEDVSDIVPPTPIDLVADGLLLDETVSDSKTARDNHTANCQTLEKFESNLVTFSDVQVSTRFIACDGNDNGQIDPGDESTCRSVCQEDPLCTDLEGYFEYSQWAGLVGGMKKVYGSIALAEKFKPLSIDYIGQDDQNGICEYALSPEGFPEYTCPDRRIESLTGTLKHIHLCGPSPTDASCGLQFWVLDPRFNGDVVIGPESDLDGDGIPLSGGDCNDNNRFQSPDNDEIPANGIDDNCNGDIDE